MSVRRDKERQPRAAKLLRSKNENYFVAVPNQTETVEKLGYAVKFSSW
jgi:hypothetical protein